MLKTCQNCKHFKDKRFSWNVQEWIICDFPLKDRSGIVDFEDGKGYIRCDKWELKEGVTKNDTETM